MQLQPDSTDTKPRVTPETLAKWQFVVDQISEAACVPATLIMQTHHEQHKVFVKSNGDQNPYTEGQSFQLHHKLYCFGVFENDGELCVEDATVDPRWDDNPDLEFGMSFYVGLPLKWPDGSVFGTICMLDRHRNQGALKFRAGLQQFCRIVEDDLALLQEIEHRRQAEIKLQHELDAREAIIKRRAQDLEDANTALRVLLTSVEAQKSEVEERITQQIKGLVLPHVSRLKQLNAEDDRALTHLDVMETNLKTITTAFTGKLAQALQALTPTEAEIVQLIVQGRSTKEIANTLSRGTSTVDFHRNNIRQKLGLTHQGKNLRQYLASLF